MGILGDIEGAAGDIVHAGEDVIQAGVGSVEGMLSSLHGFLTDAGLGNVVQELEQLANQANQLKQQLAAAASSAHWTGAAADGFRARARQREAEVTQLVGALDSAHSAVAAAYAIAGIF
ncbi:hypothetical protein [Actinospica sp.]|jgi:uncharacterized protein YukE|uniref:hypothetical protein n=1 Tax=Actinospica sp. TaxID=1872142 RepID=UPI002C7FD40F|nr:hypothetical protein [Actinospica sp.]HWG25349.1 hypothetical protein [Actinospica sp.]